MEALYFNWPGSVWVISDPHFNQDNILKYERREFKNIKEHNDKIISSIKSKVSKSDTLLLLGDLGREYEDIIASLPGYKVLIRGNHDKNSASFYKDLFNEVYNGPLFVNQFIVVSHEPLPLMGNFFINIHGHLHGAELISEYHKNVSAKMVEYTPIHLEKFLTNALNKCKLTSIRKEKFLDEWYADQYKFTDNIHKYDVPQYSDGVVVKNSKKILEWTSNFLNRKAPNMSLSNINFELIDFNPFRGKEITKENVEELVSIYLYKHNKKIAASSKKNIGKIKTIFKAHKIPDLIDREIYAILEDQYRDKYEDLDPIYLTTGKVRSIDLTNETITVAFKTKHMELSFDCFIREFGQFWWVDKDDALLWFKERYRSDGEIE